MEYECFERLAQFNQPSACLMLKLSGSGKWPDTDPWGVAFGASYMPERGLLSGKLLADGWRGVCDGFQGDQEWLVKVFDLQRPFLALVLTCDLQSLTFFVGQGNWSRVSCCHYCEVRVVSFSLQTKS